MIAWNMWAPRFWTGMHTRKTELGNSGRSLMKALYFGKIIQYFVFTQYYVSHFFTMFFDGNPHISQVLICMYECFTCYTDTVHCWDIHGILMTVIHIILCIKYLFKIGHAANFWSSGLLPLLPFTPRYL